MAQESSRSVRAARWLALVASLSAAGCAHGTSAHGLAPGDPTPLSRCGVAASLTSPLVTEWPATERSHLEQLMQEGGVAVSFAGCEKITLLEGCSTASQYEFKRTSISKDTIELSDVDELSTRLPGGAAGLELELQRTGRIAVHQTVVGQYRMAGSGAPILPATAACAKATHVIASVSVGAYRMVSGGRSSNGGDVRVGGAGVGARSAREEHVLNEAGLPSTCSEFRSRSAASAPGKGSGQKRAAEPIIEPNPDCRAPIQIHLIPLEPRAAVAAGAPRPVGPWPEAPQRPSPPPATSPNLALVYFKPPSPDERWTLRGADGSILCVLPCSWQLRSHSGTYAQRDVSDASDADRVRVPEDLDFAYGRAATATPQRQRGSKGLAVATTVTGGALLLAGAIVQGTAGRSSTVSSGYGTTTTSSGSNVGGPLMTAGIVTLLAGGAWLLFSRSERLDFDFAGSRGDVTPRPGSRWAVRPSQDGLAISF